jgi:hypothetical protein
MRKNQSQMINQINDLKSLLEAQKLKKKQAKKDSKKIFDLVTNDAFNNDSFAGLVYQESLLELMLLSMDHAKEIKTNIGRQKSIDKKLVKKIADEKKVMAWCNEHPKQAWYKYIFILEKVAELTGVASTTARTSIALWRKNNPKKS